MKVLITGGAGYIGSHTLLEVIKTGHKAVVVDTLVNGHVEAVKRVSKLTGTDIQLAVGNIRGKSFLEGIFTEFAPNQSIYIPLGAVHRMENPGKLALTLTEVQAGSYFGEDDIIRYDDVYARGQGPNG